MLYLIRRARRPFAVINRRLLATALPLLLVVSLTTPLTVSCQRKSSSGDRGIAELSALVESNQGRPAPADLQRIESAYSRSRAAALARFLRGYLYYTSQNYAAAVEALDARAIDEATAIGDYALFYRAESEAASDARSQARRDFSSLYSKYPDSLKAHAARLRAADMAVALGDPESARREVSRMAEADDPDAVYIAAQAAELTGKTDDAIKLYRKIYYELAATRASVQAEQRLAALGAAVKDHPGTLDEERARADALLESKQFNEAAQAYTNLLTRFPEAASNDAIQLHLGKSLLGARQTAQAVTPLARVSEANAELKAEALFNQAEALRRSNRAAESGVIVDRLLKQNGKSRWAQDALYNLARDLDKADHDAEAMTRYRQIVALYPKSQYAAEASYNLGWYAYRMKQYADAARLLEQHLASYRYPDSKFIGEAGFWGAKSEERLGNPGRALALYDLVNQRYRYGYHGYLAGMRAAKLRAADPSLKAEAIKSGSDLERIRQNVTYVEKIEETADGSEKAFLARADDFEVIGLGELAIKELNTAQEHAPTSPRINLRIAQYYARRGENFQATLMLRRGYPDIYSYQEADVPREAWEIMFPLIAWTTIKQEAKRYGIDPYMAAGLIRQESVFNPMAISRVGARGLMQVMPATGQLISRKQGGGSITAADLYNPAINVKLGMNYLAQMLGQFGRIEYAAAAYNAGPGRAQRWLAERGGLDIEEWIETIPFTETRGYVQGVLRYAANYRRFYKE
ncbi:MAG TPA: transglycosylase SLT domain-containing protein [Blastocatellia bacterium]|nr:transglycosylase SLT domain-containing protein [Blastocatellia bacterium]